MINVIQFYQKMMRKLSQNTAYIQLTAKEQFVLLFLTGVVMAVIFVSIVR